MVVKLRKFRKLFGKFRKLFGKFRKHKKSEQFAKTL